MRQPIDFVPSQIECLKHKQKFNLKMVLLKKTAFIDEKEKRQPISNWLAWWFTSKEHIFRAFKRKNIPESNLAEALHSAWVTQNRIQLSLCESEIDDICDMISTKQILKGY